MNFGRDILTGVAMALASLASFTAVASMLALAGMDFAGCFTACVLLALAGMLWMSWRGNHVVLVPSATVTGYLVFIAAISHGLGWQAILGMTFLASLGGLAFWHFGRKYFRAKVPPVFLWGIRLALAVFLVCLGLKMGRIIIASPWQVMMLGDTADPLMYWSMAGIVLTLAFLAGKWPGAIFAGMAVTGAATFMEGFWVIPAAPFFLPEGLDKVAGQLSLPFDSDKDMAFGLSTSFGLLVMLSAIHGSTLTAFAQADKVASGVKSLFALGTVGALCGVPPLVISPASAAGNGIGRRAVAAAAAVYVLALCCAPLVAAIADFPAMVVPVLVGGGFILLGDTAHCCPLTQDAAVRQAELLAVAIMTLLLILTGNFATSMGAAAVMYVLFMAISGRGRQVVPLIWLISGIFALYFIYGSMF